MTRENYKKLLTENAREKYISALALTERQYKGFTRFCKRNDIPAGCDRKRDFFIPLGLYGYHVTFIKTTDSGLFVKIRKYFIER